MVKMPVIQCVSCKEGIDLVVLKKLEFVKRESESDPIEARGSLQCPDCYQVYTII